MRNLILASIASFVIVTVVGTSLAATSQQDTWIFRSQVQPGQSMWGTGTHTGYNMGDKYEYTEGAFKLGFDWDLEADPGTVSGNVEGNITAEYDKFVNQLGKTTIKLSYAGIDDDSQFGITAGVRLGATPYVALDLPWPIPDFKLDIPIKMVDVDVDAKEDLTTGLDQTTSTTGRYNVLPFNADIGIVSGDINIFLDNDISFTPKTITGIMKYTHLATNTVKQVPVTFNTDADVLLLDADLNLAGAWEFSFEDFRLSDNTFSQEFGLGVEFGVGVPILSFSISAEVEVFVLPEFQFPLGFLNHGYDGDPLTVDRLGRFCVYATPEPATMVLLALGGLSLLRRRRKQ
jgi:hypothetical protein